MGNNDTGKKNGYDSSIKVNIDPKGNITEFSQKTFDFKAKEIISSTYTYDEKTKLYDVTHETHAFRKEGGDWIYVRGNENLKHTSAEAGLKKEDVLKRLGSSIATQPGLNLVDFSNEKQGVPYWIPVRKGVGPDGESSDVELTYNQRKEALVMLGLVSGKELNLLKEIEDKVAKGVLKPGAEQAALSLVSDFGNQLNKTDGAVRINAGSTVYSAEKIAEAEINKR